VLADEHLIARGTFGEISDGGGTHRVSNPPFRMSGSRAEARNLVSKLGEHGEEVLRADLGLDDEQIAALRKADALR